MFKAVFFCCWISRENRIVLKISPILRVFVVIYLMRGVGIWLKK